MMFRRDGDGCVPGQGRDGVSHGKEKLDEDRAIEAASN
jgi:hypothetical protein